MTHPALLSLPIFNLNFVFLQHDTACLPSSPVDWFERCCPTKSLGQTHVRFGVKVQISSKLPAVNYLLDLGCLHLPQHLTSPDQRCEDQLWDS